MLDIGNSVDIKKLIRIQQQQTHISECSCVGIDCPRFGVGDVVLVDVQLLDELERFAGEFFDQRSRDLSWILNWLRLPFFVVSLHFLEVLVQSFLFLRCGHTAVGDLHRSANPLLGVLRPFFLNS